MSFLRASLIRPTPGHNFDYPCWFNLIAASILEVYWFDRNMSLQDKLDWIATYNMGQEL